MDPVLVVGAGISGVGAARVLQAAGLAVTVLDRGRRIGGRMAVRTSNERPTDTGASYFTVSDPEFAAVAQDWRARGLAGAWTDSFHVYDRGELTPKPGPMRWAAPHGLRSLVEDLATGLDVQRREVTEVGPGARVDGQSAAAVVLAMPDPQARRLLHPSLAVEIEALDDPYDPVLVLAARWDRRCWPGEVDGVFVQQNDWINWIADDGRRRADQAPVLVAHSTSPVAASNLAQPDAATGPMLDAVREVLSVPEEPVTTHVHRWSYAKPSGTRDRPFFLADSGVGICGDAWSSKPRVEAAYLSGVALGRALVARLA
ncbi:MAG TPA: FAD-dependent oxidoreductase [Propionibacteriaceae bacterium]|nr:FAD-dependent oxidoreductase [Propionibacteriaceae bacterium]